MNVSHSFGHPRHVAGCQELGNRNSGKREHDGNYNDQFD
jgi:hypothetical protein